MAFASPDADDWSMGEGESLARRARRLKDSAAADRRLADDFELTGHREYARYLRRCAEETEFELQVLEQEIGCDRSGHDASPDGCDHVAGGT